MHSSSALIQIIVNSESECPMMGPSICVWDRCAFASAWERRPVTRPPDITMNCRRLVLISADRTGVFICCSQTSRRFRSEGANSILRYQKSSDWQRSCTNQRSPSCWKGSGIRSKALQNQRKRPDRFRFSEPVHQQSVASAVLLR